MREALAAITCGSMLLGAFLLASPNASDDVSVSERSRECGPEIVVKRGGDIVYERFQNGENFHYRFYWESKLAVKILIVGGKAAVQQAADLPVSYTVYLDDHQHPDFVTVEDRDEELLDALMLKTHKGKVLLMPCDPPITPKMPRGYAEPSDAAESR
jgi:hypothetical protein